MYSSRGWLCLHIVTVRVINVLCSWRQGPASHTKQAWMWRLYITANPTSISAVHPVLSVPWAHPASQLQSAFLAAHNLRAFIWKKLPTNLVQLIFIAIGWPLTRRSRQRRASARMVKWSCVYCKYIHFQLLRLWQRGEPAPALRSVQGSTSVSMATATCNR